MLWAHSREGNLAKIVYIVQYNGVKHIRTCITETVGYTGMQHTSLGVPNTHTYTPPCQSYSRVSGEVKLDCSVGLPRFSMNQRETTPPALHTQTVPVTTERREMLFLVCHQTEQTGWEESSQHIILCCAWVSECILYVFVHVVFICVCSCHSQAQLNLNFHGWLCFACT